MLNNFGQKFRDNGYQLMNDRDSPIWQNPSYWPVTFRITPIWHRVSNVNRSTPVDSTATGDDKHHSVRLRSERARLPHRRNPGEEHLVLLVPSSDPTGAFHFESVNRPLR